ncbi:MAG TPA: hypothetical protein VJ777_11315, partial [Mycobacterium sp.]|nr:hypothetical protein [Mycobacterium sp.]
MELTRRLQCWAFARPHALLVDAPGSATLRWQMEEELGRRSWDLALTPADADLLVVLGQPGPELSAAIEELWTQMQHPRRQLHIRNEADIADGLRAAASALLQRTDDDPKLEVRREAVAPDTGPHSAGHLDTGDTDGEPALPTH